MRQLAILAGLLIGLAIGVASDRPQKSPVVEDAIQVETYWPAQGGQPGTWEFFGKFPTLDQARIEAVRLGLNWRVVRVIKTQLSIKPDLITTAPVN